MKTSQLISILVLGLPAFSGCRSGQVSVPAVQPVAASPSPPSTRDGNELICFASPSLQEKSPGRFVEIKLSIVNLGTERLFTSDDGDQSTGPWWVEARRDNKPIKFSAAGDERYPGIGSFTSRPLRRGVPCETNFPVSEFFDMTIPGIYKFTFTTRVFREVQGKGVEIPVEPVTATVIENRG